MSINNLYNKLKVKIYELFCNHNWVINDIRNYSSFEKMYLSTFNIYNEYEYCSKCYKIRYGKKYKIKRWF